jgi:hypothetical protein
MVWTGEHCDSETPQVGIGGLAELALPNLPSMRVGSGGSSGKMRPFLRRDILGLLVLEAACPQAAIRDPPGEGSGPTTVPAKSRCALFRESPDSLLA